MVGSGPVLVVLGTTFRDDVRSDVLEDVQSSVPKRKELKNGSRV